MHVVGDTVVNDNRSLSDYELPEYIAAPYHTLIEQFLNG